MSERPVKSGALGMGEEIPMVETRSVSLLALALAGLIIAPSFARADDFYKGKTFTIVVGFSPGGGYDSNARAVARYLAAHIPGHPNVIVQNMPGAGSLTSVRYLDVSAPKDGTVMTVFNPGLVTQSIVAPEKVQLDFRKYGWIGVVTPDFRVCYGYGPNGVKSWDDMMHRKEFVLGSTARGSGNYINGATLREVFHAPIKQILGFPGSADQRLAIERGELDGDCGSYSSIPIEWIRDGAAHPFVRFTEQRPPEIPESAVSIGTFAKSEEQKQILDVLDASDEVGRPFIMSKQVPADRVAIIRKAFNATMQDKDFLADMEKQQFPVNPLTGEDAEAIVGKMMNAPPAIVAKAKAIYE
jgi:tripartite-type tricarboxylate transporter receptor subunit TctC